MSQQTKIEWAQWSWNFLRGCRRVSEGCGSDRGGGCYAERQAIRHAGPGGSYEGLVRSTPKGPRWTGELLFVEKILLEPLRRKTPTTYFVNSMSDLFYEKVTNEILDKAFAVMALTPQHTYQILTKRPGRMKDYFANVECEARLMTAVGSLLKDIMQPSPYRYCSEILRQTEEWIPLKNVWLGVSVEDQKTADERIPLLLDTPAAIRWISAEPLLGPIRLDGGLHRRGEAWPHVKALVSRYDRKQNLKSGASFYLGELIGLDWVVVGGESGPGARSCDIENVRSIVAHCKATDVPIFVKQLGARTTGLAADKGVFSIARDVANTAIPADAAFIWKDRKGGDPEEWPEDLRIRQFPK